MTHANPRRAMKTVSRSSQVPGFGSDSSSVELILNSVHEFPMNRGTGTSRELVRTTSGCWELRASSPKPVIEICVTAIGWVFAAVWASCWELFPEARTPPMRILIIFTLCVILLPWTWLVLRVLRERRESPKIDTKNGVVWPCGAEPADSPLQSYRSGRCWAEFGGVSLSDVVAVQLLLTSNGETEGTEIDLVLHGLSRVHLYSCGSMLTTTHTAGRLSALMEVPVLLTEHADVEASMRKLSRWYPSVVDSLVRGRVDALRDPLIVDDSGISAD